MTYDDVIDVIAVYVDAIRLRKKIRAVTHEG